MMYPTGRPSFFAQRYIRLLTKTCAAQEISTNAFALCVIIATTEDAKRYTGPVTFYNEQLMPILGVRKWESLSRARKAAIYSGWLHYEAPPNGASKPGRYWVTIPNGLASLPDGGCDEHPEPYPKNGDGQSEDTSKAYPKNGYGKGDDTPKAYTENGDGRGYGRGELSILCPNPKEEEAAPSPLSEEKKPAKGKRSKSKQTEPDFDPLAVDLPFDSAEFREAWSTWVQHRAENSKRWPPLKSAMVATQLKQITRMGEQRAIAMIENTVGHGWQGLREPDSSKPSTNAPNTKPVDTSTNGLMANMTEKGGVQWL